MSTLTKAQVMANVLKDALSVCQNICSVDGRKSAVLGHDDLARQSFHQAQLMFEVANDDVLLDKLAARVVQIMHGTPRKKPKTTKQVFKDIRITNDGGFRGTLADRHGECAFSASFNFFLIRQAWEKGCEEIEQHADGFGPGMGTNGDWSAIRDSTPDAKNKMLEVALNFLFQD